DEGEPSTRYMRHEMNVSMLSRRHLFCRVLYLDDSTRRQWLVVSATKCQLRESTGVPPRHITAVPLFRTAQALVRRLSRMRAPSPAATAERCPWAIMRVTSAELFINASRPTVSTIIATITSDRKSTRLNSSHEWISYA